LGHFEQKIRQHAAKSNLEYKCFLPFQKAKKPGGEARSAIGKCSMHPKEDSFSPESTIALKNNGYAPGLPKPFKQEKNIWGKKARLFLKEAMESAAWD